MLKLSSSEGPHTARERLQPARKAEIRRRLVSGFYRERRVLEAIARRVLASGDL